MFYNLINYQYIIPFAIGLTFYIHVYIGIPMLFFLHGGQPRAADLYVYAACKLNCTKVYYIVQILVFHFNHSCTIYCHSPNICPELTYNPGLLIYFLFNEIVLLCAALSVYKYKLYHYTSTYYHIKLLHLPLISSCRLHM